MESFKSGYLLDVSGWFPWFDIVQVQVLQVIWRPDDFSVHPASVAHNSNVLFRPIHLRSADSLGKTLERWKPLGEAEFVG